MERPSIYRNNYLSLVTNFQFMLSLCVLSDLLVTNLQFMFPLCVLSDLSDDVRLATKIIPCSHVTNTSS